MEGKTTAWKTNMKITNEKDNKNIDVACKIANAIVTEIANEFITFGQTERVDESSILNRNVYIDDIHHLEEKYKSNKTVLVDRSNLNKPTVSNNDSNSIEKKFESLMKIQTNAITQKTVTDSTTEIVATDADNNESIIFSENISMHRYADSFFKIHSNGHLEVRKDSCGHSHIYLYRENDPDACADLIINSDLEISAKFVRKQLTDYILTATDPYTLDVKTYSIHFMTKANFKKFFDVFVWAQRESDALIHVLNSEKKKKIINDVNKDDVKKSSIDGICVTKLEEEESAISVARENRDFRSWFAEYCTLS